MNKNKLDISKPLRLRGSDRYNFRILATDSGRIDSNGLSRPFVIEVWAKSEGERDASVYYNLENGRMHEGNFKHDFDLLQVSEPRPWTKEEMFSLQVVKFWFRYKTWLKGAFRIPVGLHSTGELILPMNPHSSDNGFISLTPQQLFDQCECSSDEGETWTHCGPKL